MYVYIALCATPTLMHMHTHTQATECGYYRVAQLLIASKPDTILIKDNKNRLPIDMLKDVDTHWRQLLQDK